MATVLGVKASAKNTTRSGIEKQVLDFSEKAIKNGWGCDDIPGPAPISKMDIESSIRHQGVPERIITTFTDNDEVKKTSAIKAVELFMKSEKGGWCLVLAGHKGCGKSTAAAHYLFEATKKCTPTSAPKDKRWWTAANVCRVSSYNKDLENLMTLPVLIIDDLGVEYMDKGGHFRHRLDELLDARYSNFRKTIITTNLNKKDFEDRYGGRVTSRIREGFKDGGDYAVINDKSLRV